MRAEGQRRTEATKARMGIASVPPAMINKFTTSRSAAMAHLKKHEYRDYTHAVTQEHNTSGEGKVCIQ